MQTEVIMLSEIEDYLKFVELQRDLVVRLHTYKESQELQLKRLKDIERVAKNLALLKQKNKFKILGDSRDEVLKAIKKYARYM